MTHYWKIFEGCCQCCRAAGLRAAAAAAPPAAAAAARSMMPVADGRTDERKDGPLGTPHSRCPPPPVGVREGRRDAGVLAFLPIMQSMTCALRTVFFDIT